MRGIEEELQTSKFQNEIHKAHLNVLFTASWLRSKISVALKPFGLTSEQYNVLRILRGQYPNGIRVKDITYRMLERNSNTTRIIDRLEEKNLALRKTSEEDGRERYIQATETGMELLSKIDASWKKSSPHNSKMSQKDAKVLNQLLDSLRG